MTIPHAVLEIDALRERIAELEAALRETELLLTGLAMSPVRVAVCPDSKLEATLVRAREALQKSTR